MNRFIAWITWNNLGYVLSHEGSFCDGLKCRKPELKRATGWKPLSVGILHRVFSASVVCDENGIFLLFQLGLGCCVMRLYMDELWMSAKRGLLAISNSIYDRVQNPRHRWLECPCLSWIASCTVLRTIFISWLLKKGSKTYSTACDLNVGILINRIEVIRAINPAIVIRI